MKRFFTSLVTLMFVLVSANLVFAATFTVINLNDSGAGSLRQAIIDANAAGAGPHTIQFTVSGTIAIGSPLPALTVSGVTIDPGANGQTITVDAQGGNINRDIFTLNNGANTTTIKNITLEGTGTEAIQINGNLTGVTLENITIQSKNGSECNCINHGIYVGGTATDMTITNVTVRDLQYGATWGVRFLKTVTNVTIDGLTVEDLGGGDSRGMQFQGVVNGLSILNAVIDLDDKNSGNDGNYGIYFNTTTTGVTLDNVTVHDAEIYSLYFGGVANTPTIENSTFDNQVGGNAYPMIRFNNTVNNLDIDNITVNADFTGSTNDHNYGIYFYGAVQTASITNSDFIEADVAGIWFNGTNKDNITISGNTFTKNGSGADAQGGLIFTNTRNTTSDAGPVLVQNNTFFANNGEAIGVYPGNSVSYVVPNFTITDNIIYNTKSNYGAINIQYVDKINITDNSIYNNRGRGIELTYSGNCNYQSPNVPTIVSSTPTMAGYDVVITLPSICATGCDVEVFVSKPQYYGVGGEVYVTTIMGATSGLATYSIPCADPLCTGAPYGVWTANLKVTSKNCGTSEFSNKLAVQPNGPACVSSGIKLWLRADLGLYNSNLDIPDADGQVIGFWEEFSGGGAPSSSTIVNDPRTKLSGMNFNPVADMDGDVIRGLHSPAQTWLNSNAFTTVAAFKPQTNIGNGDRLFVLYSNGAADWNTNAAQIEFYRTGNNVHSYRGSTLLQPSIPGVGTAFGKAGVFASVTDAATHSLYYNGTSQGTNNYSKGNVSAEQWFVGGGYSGGWCCGAEVDFGEVITYNRKLTDSELQKVQTYLAVKYGVTMTQDYIASNDAVWWDISDNTGYNNGIAGLARDDCSVFEQKQAKSESMTDLVTIALGDSIASNNLENENTITTDASAFLWGNNNLTTAFDEVFVNPFADSRMKRVWRVRKTAWTDQNITVCLDGGNSNKTLIISHSDPTFATVTHFRPLNAQGCVTINSSDFDADSYFTFSNQVVGPNCATTGIRLWLRGDIGFSGGTNSWIDFSGYDVPNVVSAGSLGTGTMNYNTAADFDGGSDEYTISLNINPTVNDPITVYTVYEADVISRDLWGNDNGGYDRAQRMFDVNGNGSAPDYIGGNIAGRTLINGVVLDDGQTNGSYVYIDGKQVYNFTHANSNGGQTTLQLGDIDGYSLRFDGRIGEFVIYQGALDATTRNKVESYLALKYGVTLDQSAGSGGMNYVDSDGDPYWNADASDIYENDIAGLGRDDCTDLYQKQSKSVNDDALVSFALGDEFVTNNNLNTNTIAADQSFFVWANNNQSTNFDQTVSNPNIISTVRTGRIWQVQKTNWTDQVVTLCFSGDATNTNLLISADPTFATGVEELQLEESTGCVGLNTSLIADNAYFTFAKDFKGPACVNAGVKLWLRSDAGVALNGANLSTWQDQSGRGNHSTTTNGTVVYNENNLNFYPSFNFTHSGADGINGPNLGMSGDNSYGVIFVTQPTASANGHDVFSIADAYSGVVHYTTTSGGRMELYSNNGGITPGGVASLLNQPHIFGFNSNSNGTGYLNGTTGSSRTPGTLASSTRGYKIGDFLANGDGLGMDFAEVVVYNVNLSATELQRINSYMALKYGITLNNGATDYLASDGVTTMWKASDNVGYGQDIAGIGLDQCTDLHQKQSKSVNSDALITMAIGDSVASSNAANLNEVLVDNTFLVWSNNGASTVIDQAVNKMGINSTMRMSRIWKVDKSDDWSDLDITICIPQMGERYLLIDKNSTGFDDDGNTVEYRFDFAKSCITLNSSELPDGAYFTLSTEITGPACVNDGIKMWLRADYSIPASGKVASWVDFSGNSKTPAQASAGNQPDVLTGNQFNFHSVVEFTGNEVLAIPGGIPHDNLKIFAVGKRANNTTNWKTMFRGAVSDHQLMGHFSNNTLGYYDNDNVLFKGSGLTLSATTPQLMTMKHDAATNQLVPELNDLAGTTLNGINETNRALDYFGNYQGGAQPFGAIAEVAVYNSSTMTAAEENKIESYLALKYGITLDQTTPTNYTASEGTVVWDATANATYNNDIAGIGRDDCTELYQKQSKSVNSDALVTMALGDAVATTNKDNDFTLANDISFLVWGNNNGSTEFSTSLNGTEATARISRVWKVDKSAAWEDTEIFVCFDNQDDLSFLIVNNTDPNFASIDAEHRLDANGCVNILSSDLPDGAYFTMGRELYGPACVNAGIKLWLRADIGTGVGNMVNGTGWNDYSNNNNHFTTVVSDPARVDGGLNFNHYFEFDGGDYLSKPSISTAFTQGEVFSVLRTRSNAGHAYAFGGQSNNHYRTDDNYENFGTNDRIGWRNSTNAILDAHPGLTINPLMFEPEDWNVYNVYSATNSWAASYNGYVKAQTSNNTVAFNEDVTNYIGRGEFDVLNGDVGEVILYNRKLADFERLKVNSYLALKYGISLDQSTNTDYVASDWNGTTGTKMWVNDNDGYEYDIAGIGRDDCTDLYQKQSKSVNSDALISMALGATLEADNASNIETINNDKSFLVWSNNNLATTFIENVSLSGIGSTTRMARVWKVDKSSNWADQDITICVSQSGERYLLIDSETDAGDGIFNEVANVTEYVLDVSSGCVTINSGDLPDGAYFSLGMKIAGPACVDAGIKLWLRADYGISTSGSTVSSWTDYSGNAHQFVQNGANPLPLYETTNTNFNFNPSLDFVATGAEQLRDATVGDLVDPATPDLYSMFMVIVKEADNQRPLTFANSGSNFYAMDVNVAGRASAPFDYENALTIPSNQTKILGITYDGTAPNRRGYHNGKLTVDPTLTTALTINDISNGQAELGAANGNGNFGGHMAEVVVYNRQVTLTEAQQINSYLALKYGITLDQSASSGGNNYLASDGTAYWTADATDTYEHDIAGMGRDSCTDLHQKQSKSVNSDDIVTMALGDAVAASNAANLNLIPFDKSFLVWANNDGNFDFGADAMGTNATARMNRIWRVQKTTNWEDQTVTVCFTGYNDTEYLLISNSDPLFGTVNAEHQLDANGCVSFDSGELPDDAYFTLGRALRGPACVNGGIKLWLRADDLAAGNLVNALGWTDYSNNENDFTTVVSDPANISGGLNYNNYVEFDGGDYLSKPSISSAFTQGEVFTVVKTRSNTGHAYAFGGESNNHYRTDDIYENFGTNSRVGWRNSTNALLDGSATINPVIFEPEDWNVYSVYAAPSDWAASFNGYIKAKNNTNVVNFNADATNYIGRGELDILTGDVGEVILYSRKLTDAERQKVQSYLAIKYGITLSGDNDGDGTAFETGALNEGDYVASNDAVFWDASANSTYHNDIAGIGRDSCTGLLQKQSASINTGSVVRMALGDAFEVDNISNTSTITADRSFLVWGSNGMNTTFGTSVDYSTTNMYNSTVRMNRVWKVQKTNWTDQDITLCFNQSGERYLLVDENGGSFEDDANTKEYTLNFVTGCITFSSSSLPNDAIFTLGTKITGPACVNAGIQVWLRGDYNAAPAEWVDFSGNQKNATSSGVNQPAYLANAINYNPALDFDGTNDLMNMPVNINPSSFDPITVFTVYVTDESVENALWGNDDAAGWDRALSTTRVMTNNTAVAYSDGNTIGVPKVSAVVLDDGLTNGSYVYVDGAQKLNFTHSNAEGGITTTTIGRAGNWTGMSYLDGRMAEFAIYQGALSDDERRRIESYLALKYGITLDVPAANADYDYVSYNGTSEVVMWSAVDNFGYHNDIAGIGREDCTELHQRQSKSVNSDAIVTMSMGDAIAATNATNPNDVGTDRTFLVWGNNNGILDFLDDAEGAPNAKARLDRTWKVDKSASWQDDAITICFTSAYADQYLIIDNDADFSSVTTEVLLDGNGCATISSALLPDAAHFTVGRALQGPACVDGGVQLWLRADAGLQVNGSNELTAWGDQSGNNQAETIFGTPVLVNSGTNFNPVINLTGNGTDYINYSNFANNWSEGAGFIVVRAAADPQPVGNSTGLWTLGGDAVDESNFPWTDGSIYEAFGSSAGRTTVNPTEPLDVFNVYRVTVDPALTNEQEIFLNNKKLGDANITVSFANSRLSIGRNAETAATRTFAGEIAEVVLYNKVLTTQEKLRIESYLALKYGTTLDQTITNTDYVASDWNGTTGTKMWVNDNDGFEHDIAGLGRDTCTDLHQKQATSVNADDVVTFALGSAVEATNSDNPNDVINDRSFFTWANDNGNTDVFSTSVTATNAELRMARIWKVDKFNWQDQDITICFDGQIGERYLLIDNNSATLASIDKEIPLDPLTGCATFSSAELGHDYYFSLGTKILAPGCADNADILTWLRGDYGAGVSQWNDFSGRTTHATQATSGDQPATGSLMNFNPALDFDGGDFMTLSGLDINYTVTDRNPITILSVYQADVTDRGIWGNENGGNDRALYMHQVANGVGNTTYSGGNSINQTSLVTTIMDEGTTDGSFIFANGQRTLTFTQSGSGGGTTGTFLGDDNGTGTANTAFDGRIAEFAVYRGALTAAQRQQAESYLAIKYGLTLSNDNDGNTTTFEAPNANGVHEGDYIASDGMTVIWDAGANSAYHNDVAGIGRDTCTALNQKQSRSANSDDIVTMALGSAVEVTNAANTNTFTNDLAFLVWGNDDGNATFNTAQTGMFVNARLGRTWKVQKSANWDDTQDITICFDSFDDGNYLLISDNNTFGTLDLEQQLDASGCTTINSAVLENSDFFTLGALVVGPACVNPGIVMWLRADAGTIDGTAWNDQSGNDINATQGTMTNEPTLNAAAMNFNPAMVFDGVDNFMEIAPLNDLPYGANNRTIITVGYSSNTTGNRWLFSYGTNTASDANFWGQQGTTGNYGGWADDVTSANYWTANVPALTVNTYDGTNATIAKDGKSLVSTAKSWTTLQNVGYLGRQVSGSEYWNGGIGEIVVYDRVLSAGELQQVNSYLALKYGISLDQTTPQDYVASDGSTLMWEAAANGAYNNDIAGIGLDECTGLNQKQSKSSSVDAVITMGLGAVEPDNTSNSNVFPSNLSFMTWANDNGTLSEITTDLPAQFTVNAKRLAREWKVDETNTVGAVQVKANLNVPPLAGAISGTVASEIRLLIDRDGDGNFTTGTVDIITATDYSSGVATFDNVDFQDGDVFTVGTKLPDVTLSVKVLLQGAAIDATAGMMRNDLQTYGPPLMMPTTDPYLGTTTYPDMNNDAGVAGAVTDWVLVQIRDATDPSLVLEQKALLVQTDGEVVDETGAAPKFAPQAGAVHIIVQHRNHLAVMSNSIAVFQDAVSYDFTTALTQAYKEDPGDPDPMIQVNGFWTMWAGDKNMDGVIDNLDLTDVKQDFDLFLFEDYFLTDVNLDSVVDNLDLTLTKTNFDLFPYSPIIFY